jgi:CubicO group peptidase (beta-lactamase class C family)
MSFRHPGKYQPAQGLRVALAVLCLAIHSASAQNATSLPSTPPTPPGPVSLTAAQIADFRDYLRTSRTLAHLPGLAVAVVQPGRVLILDGSGTRSALANDADAAVTPDTRFALGDASQAFNSLLLARLADQHVLDLEKPARRSWSDFRLAEPAATHDVTLSQLLQMTAGIPDYVDRLLNPPHNSVGDLFAALAQIPLLAQPGDSFSYSAASPAAAGYLATLSANHQLALGDTLPAAYAALAQAQLFDPLGMKHTSYGPPSPLAAANDAVGHVLGPTGAWVPMPATNAALGALTPANGLRASASDLAAWLRLELSGGLLPDGTRFLGESSVQDRWRPVTVRDSQQYGMGWYRQYYRGIELIVTHGEADNQSALIIIIPRYRTALAALFNSGGHATAVVLQDIQLNFTDFLREAAGGS